MNLMTNGQVRLAKVVAFSKALYFIKHYSLLLLLKTLQLLFSMLTSVSL